MAKTYDCFMFFNEFDLLRIRLREIYDWVDFFVLVEGSHTHTGNPKPFYFKEHQGEFKEFGDKVIARTVDLPPHGKEPWFGWGREIFQRSAINGILEERGLDDQDIVLSGDVDEIPKTKVIEEYRERTDICAIEETTYHYNLNCMLETPTLDPKICRYKSVKEVGVSDLRYYHHAHPVHVIRNGGWHLSFMGGTARIIEKMKSYAHYDVRDPNMATYSSRENVEASVKAEKSLFQRDDVKYLHVNGYPSLPKHITENLKSFAASGWIVDPIG
jgi:beta-1,4-mannosyl-glycoprotein beta-1,4-N-acetylglucosaminyltransferase